MEEQRDPLEGSSGRWAFSVILVELRDATFPLIRDTKWLAGVSLLLSGILYFPSQVEELYRSVIADADRSPTGLLLFYLSLCAIAVLIWFGTTQVALTSEYAVKGKPAHPFFRRFWPGFLGVTPLVASAMSQLASTPTRRFYQKEQAIRDLFNIPGSVWDKLDVELASSVGRGLFVSGCLTLALSLVFAGGLAIYSERLDGLFRRINRRYFRNQRSFGSTIALIVCLAAAFFLSPVTLPQAIGPFGILTAFAACIVLFSTHLSIITIKYRFPFMPILFAGAALFSLADLNDNHVFRTLKQSTTFNQPSLEDAFEKWVNRRPDFQTYEDEYPVYIVAAQGGGIYAATQTALFLSRIQDVCPAFRDHLFAISAVSGGSVGAAVFASGLRAVPELPRASVQAGPCPDITRFLTKQFTPSDEKPKPLEKYSLDVLSSDFLSPLMAAAFFTDFSQRFLPFHVPFLFDRASAFEFALEQAAERADGSNMLKENYLTHWTPEANVPALILNATDVASGRRVIFSPFTFGAASSSVSNSSARTQELGNDSLVLFHSLRPSASNGSIAGVRLSTAASISARFPWISPAATVNTENGTPLDPAKKIRLVDGGYVDNSGVETALDIREVLEQKIAKINASLDSKRVARSSVSEKYPRVVLKLIVLGGGNYPTRDSYGLGETAEPIRALLSTRQSRAYVAINRASRIFSPISHQIAVHGTTTNIVLSNLRIAKLENEYYDLPLGWSVSQRTRDIIRKQSGRYWDCEFNSSFTQSSLAGVSETDCVQLFVYHELNQSVSSAVQETAVANYYNNALVVKKRADRARFDDADKNDIIRCYAKDQPAWRFSQSLVLHALLDEWSVYPDEKDERELAYILGTAAHETATFRVFVESLSYSSPERVAKFAAPTRRRFASVEDARPYVNQPEDLANYIYGNRLGNTQEGDGWRFRSRGIFPIVGRDNYRFYAQLTKTPLEDDPDLILNRYIGARVTFAFFFGKRNILAPYFNAVNEDWVGARKELPGLPKDDKGLPEGATEVAAKGKQFFECIVEVRERKRPSSRISFN